MAQIISSTKIGIDSKVQDEKCHVGVAKWVESKRRVVLRGTHTVNTVQVEYTLARKVSARRYRLREKTCWDAEAIAGTFRIALGISRGDYSSCVNAQRSNIEYEGPSHVVQLGVL